MLEMVRLSDEEVGELIKIADGGLIGYKRAPWYEIVFTLGIVALVKDPIYSSNLSQQLDAIRKLGLSRNKISLEYLEKLIECREHRVNEDAANSCGDYGHSYHPYAKGPLESALSGSWANQEAPVDGAPYYCPRDEYAFETIEHALKQLQNI